MPVALNELKTEYNRKKAFIVTDSFLFKSGFTKNITDKLDELGIQYACFYDVAPDPTLGCAMKGVEQIRDFEPDVIIALGGGSPMDAAKIMWVLYEHPRPTSSPCPWTSWISASVFTSSPRWARRL